MNHQLGVNGCLLAVQQACRAHPGATLREWTADPHARVRYQVGRSWRMVHPDAVDAIDVDGRRRWIYLEVDRGTAELRRYGLKLWRYARFYLSGSWRREYERFPEVPTVATHSPRAGRMMVEIDDAVQSFGPTEAQDLRVGLGVAVTREPAFLADPSGRVWAPIFSVGRRESLLPPGSAADFEPAAAPSYEG